MCVKVCVCSIESRSIRAILFASIPSHESFFACNILAFKLIYGGFEGVSTCICILYTFMMRVYFTILLMTEGLFIVLTNYTTNYTAKKIPRRKIIDPVQYVR